MVHLCMSQLDEKPHEDSALEIEPVSGEIVRFICQLAKGITINMLECVLSCSMDVQCPRKYLTIVSVNGGRALALAWPGPRSSSLI